MMNLLYPASWKDYELIDSGDFEKLERFGKYVLARPEPQAIWQKVLPEQDWKKLTTARFAREQSDKFRFTDDVKGGWNKQSAMPESWQVNYQYKQLQLSLRLALTGFGHVGIFPEQGENWNFIYDTITGWNALKPKVLNLFAYTGAASVVAKAAGADVTHVDSIKQVVTWANENSQLSKLNDIRWVVEDALKFVKRELKRGNKYHGIILDPPAFGHGPNGEKWKLEEQLNEMVSHVLELLHDDQHFLILNAYSLGLSSLILENLLIHKAKENLEIGELFLAATSGVKLPLGVFGRFAKL
jgi:23S rRNA (cytosine1962-C5)-methyltransferase